MICTGCPRGCAAERTAREGRGFCRMGTDPVVARAAPHFGEEPCISGPGGSGTVFFSGCTMGCVFCQNAKISIGGYGKAMTPKELRDLFFSLADKGVCNLNLVTGGHFIPAIAEALEGGFPLPVVWNSSGYESVEALRMLEGKVQVYLPDMKYAESSLSARYSHAPNYPETAKAAILEMFRQTGPYVMTEDGLLTRGVAIRHLVMPGALLNSFAVMDWVEETFSPGDVLFSLMSQYTPQPGGAAFPELCRTLTAEEHEAAVGYLMDSGIEDGFYQELEAAGEDFIPAFDLTGVDKQPNL